MQTPGQTLREFFLERRSKNPAYSTRAFARDLGVSQTMISLLLSGKRAVSMKRAVQFSEALGMDEAVTEKFLTAVALHSARNSAGRPYLKPAIAKGSPKSSLDSAPDSPADNSFPEDIFQLELDRFRTVSQWYNFAILDLTTTTGFKPQPNWIARRLGLSTIEVKEAMDRLTRLGLLEIKGRTWKKTATKLAIPTHQTTAAMRSFHRQLIEKALVALSSPKPEDFAARDITGTTMAINPERIESAKQMIGDFRRKLANHLTTGKCTEVYQLNVQLFPLTKRDVL